MQKQKTLIKIQKCLSKNFLDFNKEQQERIQKESDLIGESVLVTVPLEISPKEQS